MVNRSNDESTPGHSSKVARLIDEYDLGGIGDKLEKRWTAEDDSRMSLRALAEQFNIRLVERAMSREGAQLLDGTAENMYRLLSGADVSDADRTRARRQLERQGVDVKKLQSDFVSYQAIRTYLQGVRQATYEREESDRLETETMNIQRLQSRTATIVGNKLERLSKTGQLRLGEVRTISNVTVICDICGGQYDVGEFLDRGGCECED